jgi:hypothetical protein
MTRGVLVNESWWGLPWLLALCVLVLAMTWVIYR